MLVELDCVIWVSGYGAHVAVEIHASAKDVSEAVYGSSKSCDSHSFDSE